MRSTMGASHEFRSGEGLLWQGSQKLAGSEELCLLRRGRHAGALEALLANVHEEVRNRYYGCGIVVPQDLRDARVLDLGSGSGRDVYLISQLVGPSGEVVGVDMTDEQLAVADLHIDWHMRGRSAIQPAMCASSRAISRTQRA